MDDKKLTIRTKFFALTLWSAVFALVYNFSAWYISRLDNVPSFVFGFERYIPFLNWTIIPYMTSGIFICLVFILCKTRKELVVLTKRMLFVTIVAGICFILFPLKFSLPKPDVSNTVLGFSFDLLVKFDSPFNQSPSLHIAYAFIFWTVLRKFNKGWRTVIILWLILLGISTLTTYQHHFIDVLTGNILAHLSFIIIPYDKNNFIYRNFHVANFYFLLGWILISAAILLYNFDGLIWVILPWPAVVVMLIGYQYQKNNIYFLKDKNGNISLFKKIFYLPYLLIYWLFWKFRRKNNVPLEILPKIYISSKPGKEDLKHFKISRNTSVYDLSAELEAIPEIKENSSYYFFPYLDIAMFDAEETRKLIIQITKNYKQLPEDGKILIHCTMGYTRSSIIGALVMKNILSLPLDQTITRIRSINKNAVIHSYLLDFLTKFKL